MRRTFAGVAVATALLIAACGDDDDSSTLRPVSDSEQPGTGESPTPGAEDPAPTGSDLDAVGQAFCDFFLASGPEASRWDMAEAAALTPPAEIADPWQSILNEEPGFSHHSEVTRWATDNCF